MDAASPAARLSALEAELAAKSSRIAELEARVASLEADNARLRKAMAKGEGADRTGEEDPIFGRLEEGLGGHRQAAVEMVGCDVILLGDGEEKIAVNASMGESREEGIGVEGGSGGSEGSGRCDGNAGLEDDDVSATARVNKRVAARIFASDSEDEDVGSGKRRNAKDDGYGDDDDDYDQEVSVMLSKKRVAARVITSDSEDEDARLGKHGSSNVVTSGREDEDVSLSRHVTPSSKRALLGVSDSDDEEGEEAARLVNSEPASLAPATQIGRGEDEDEDDMIPICQVLKKMRKERVPDDGDDELADAKGCSAHATRRSARLVKNQSRGGQAKRQVLNFVEPREYEGSEDDMEEDDDMDEFINDDSSETASDSAEESCAEPEASAASAPNEEASPKPEESDSEVDYPGVMASIGRKRKAKDWKFEGEMLAAFHEDPELCLKAVCALYRKQTDEEQSEKAALFHNKQGFSHNDAARGSRIAEFLLDGDLDGPPKKTILDLEKYDPHALKFCHKVASHYSKQLFTIYQNKEDPYFLP
ncbi:hypothetical protein ACP70R_030906 [Stipagrostis hirtigluma subsp. patula]